MLTITKYEQLIIYLVYSLKYASLIPPNQINFLPCINYTLVRRGLGMI